MLLHPVVYVTNDGRRITVPEGYITDFATIPRIFWVLLPPLGRYLYAALIHDRLYWMHNRGHDLSYSRAYADQIMREVMSASEVKPWQRWLIYAGVRVGGWVCWK